MNYEKKQWFNHPIGGGVKMDNRTNILRCAAELFYQKGYDAVGVQEIVARAGTTKPTLYYYFGSKYGLLENILETYYAPFLESLEKASFYDGDVPKTLYKTCIEYLKLAMKNKTLYLFVLSLIYSARENDTYKAVRPYMVRTHEIIVQIFTKAEEKLGNINGRHQQFASGFEGIINFYLIYYFEIGEPEIDIEEVGRNLVNQFMYGIFS